MIYFLTMNIESLTPPSIDGFFSGSILTAIADFFSFIFTFISNVVSALTNFYDTLVEINTYVIQLGNSAQSGVASDLPVLQCVGTYRYLMGDPVFYMTYIMVVTGCLFTIYKLTLLLIKVFKEMKNNITSQGKTSAGLMSFLSQLFK